MLSSKEKFKEQFLNAMKEVNCSHSISYDPLNEVHIVNIKQYGGVDEDSSSAIMRAASRWFKYDKPSIIDGSHVSVLYQTVSATLPKIH